MIERTQLFNNGGKAIFRDLQLDRPTLVDGEFEPVIMSEDWLKKVGQMPGEVVDIEPINDAVYDGEGECIAGADEVELSILRVTHQDGSATIEPVYKLFPIDGNRHGMLRNSLLVYDDVMGKLEARHNLDEKFKELGVEPASFADYHLLWMYCRMHDINMYQAKYRTSAFSAEKWMKILPGGRIDEDLCWRYSP